MTTTPDPGPDTPRKQHGDALDEAVDNDAATPTDRPDQDGAQGADAAE